MKVIALVSGGKDSCYSMQLCKQHGHEIVALANLLPEETAPDELDSFMFQTVGHQLVGAYTACMGLPLFRKRISGSSSLQELGYTPTAGDEVEDLYLLLAYIKECIPGVQAVASGAIASDYQRLRVENVCSRLNLVSLAYLWHQPQRLLLRGMVQSGLEAILVKVACLGLQPHKHLGRTIAALEPHLLNLNEMYGCNVCGEGGEYETLTLDCPMFTKGRIVLDKYEIEHGSAGVGHLVPVAFHVEPKAPPQPDASGAASAGAADHVPPGHPHGHSRGEHPPAGLHGRLSAQYAPDIRMVPPDYVPAPRTSDKCAAGVVNAHVNVHANATGARAGAAGYTASGPIATAAAAALSGLSLSASASPSGSPGAGSIGSPLATLTASPGTAAASPLSPRVLGTYSTTAASTPPGTGGSEQLLAAVSPPAFGVQVLLTTGSDYVQLACRAVRTRSSLPSDVTELDTTAALNALLAAAQQELAALHVSLSHCLFVHLFLANMGHFQAANGVYCKYFSSRDPPSRACLQVCLPQECPVMCEFLLARGAAPPPPGTPASVHVVRHARKVLHVQSISTWAPSCIGPYSQATSYRGLVYMAGVIPLDPPTMMIAGGEITAQVLRAMASCEAVAIAQRSTVVGAALGLTVYLSLAAGTGAGAAGGSGGGAGGGSCGCGDRSSGGGAEARALARSAVEALLEHGLPGYPQPSHRASVPSAGSSGNGMGLSLSGGGARPAAPRFGRSNTFGSGATPTAAKGQYGSATGMAVLSRRVVLGADGLDEDEEERAAAAAAGEDEGPGLEAVLDRYLQPPEVRCPVRPSVLYVVVPALPRGALVEIQPLCLEVEALAVTRRLTAGQEGLKQQRRNLSHVDTPSLAHQHHHTHPQPGSQLPPPGAVTNTWSELPRTPRASMESFAASRSSTHGSSPLPWQCSTDALNAAMAQGLVDPTAVAAAAMSSPHRVSSQGMLHMLQRQRSSILSNSSGGGATPNGQQQQQRQQPQLDGFGSLTLAAPSASPPAHPNSQGRTDRQPQAPTSRGPSAGSADQSSTSRGSSGSQVLIPAMPALTSQPPPRASGSSGTLRPRSSASGIMRDAIAASAAAAAGLPGCMSRNSFSGGSSSSSAAAPFLSRSSLDGSILSFEVSSGAAPRSSGTAFPASLPRFSMSSILPGPPAGMGTSVGAGMAMGPTGVAGSAPLPGPLGPRQMAEAGGFAGGVERSHRSSDGSIGSAEGGRRSGNGSAGEGRRSVSGLTSSAPTSVPDKEFQFAAPHAAPEEAAAGAAGPAAPNASPGPQGRSPFETATTAAAAAVVVTATPVSPLPFLPARSSSSFSSRVPPLAVPYLSVPVHSSPHQPPSHTHNAPHSPGPTGPVAPLSPVQPAIATPPPAPGGGSGNDVMVSTVCCYGQVLRSIFHLPPSVFGPGVTTAQLTRRFRRAAASVLAAHGMDMSCLIWARVWYEKGAMVLDDEHGYGYCLRPVHAGGARANQPVSDEDPEAVPEQLGEAEEEGRKGLGSRAGSRSRSRLGGVEEGEEEEGDGADEAGAIEREWRLGERRKAAWVRTARTSADAAELDADAPGGGGGGQFGRRTCPPMYDNVYDNGHKVHEHGSHVPRRSPHRRHSLQVHHGHSPHGGSHPVHLSPHGQGQLHRSHGHHGGVQEAGPHHFHVSWVPVHRVMTNANPAPEVCVGVLELLAALPAA